VLVDAETARRSLRDGLRVEAAAGIE
jgi:hypothetical protein